MYKSPSTKKEFIERTSSIIQQYQAQENKLGTEFYDVTLYLNCLLGLVILPREWKINELSDKSIPDNILKTLTKVQDTNGKAIEIGFKEYIIGLRNGIVHFGQKESLVFEESNGIISSIQIESEYTINRVKKYASFLFNLTDGNQLTDAINEILVFIN